MPDVQSRRSGPQTAQQTGAEQTPSGLAGVQARAVWATAAVGCSPAHLQPGLDKSIKSKIN
jgi:hypothetical protein